MLDKIKFLMKYFLHLVYKIFKNSYYDIMYYKYRQKYNIAKTFRFNGENIFLYGDGEIILGENSYIGDYSTIQAVKGQKIIIGNNCWIGVNVFIKEGVIIGDNVVIGGGKCCC